jgi:hypothetical protein
VIICTESERSYYSALNLPYVTTYSLEDDPTLLQGLAHADITAKALVWLERVVDSYMDMQRGEVCD